MRHRLSQMKSQPMNECITISFPKSLYALSAIDNAMAAYSNFANIELEQAGDAWTVRLGCAGAKIPLEKVSLEFGNYVLARTVESNR